MEPIELLLSSVRYTKTGDYFLAELSALHIYMPKKDKDEIRTVLRLKDDPKIRVDFNHSGIDESNIEEMMDCENQQEVVRKALQNQEIPARNRKNNQNGICSYVEDIKGTFLVRESGENLIYLVMYEEKEDYEKQEKEITDTVRRMTQSGREFIKERQWLDALTKIIQIRTFYLKKMDEGFLTLAQRSDLVWDVEQEWLISVCKDINEKEDCLHQELSSASLEDALSPQYFQQKKGVLADVIQNYELITKHYQSYLTSLGYYDGYKEKIAQFKNFKTRLTSLESLSNKLGPLKENYAQARKKPEVKKHQKDKMKERFAVKKLSRNVEKLDLILERLNVSEPTFTDLPISHLQKTLYLFAYELLELSVEELSRTDLSTEKKASFDKVTAKHRPKQEEYINLNRPAQKILPLSADANKELYAYYAPNPNPES